MSQKHFDCLTGRNDKVCFSISIEISGSRCGIVITKHSLRHGSSHRLECAITVRQKHGNGACAATRICGYVDQIVAPIAIDVENEGALIASSYEVRNRNRILNVPSPRPERDEAVKSRPPPVQPRSHPCACRR